MKRFSPLLEGLGVGAVVTGISLIYLPAALIVAGASILVFILLEERAS